ncbi:MAG: hypothetical protein RJA22_514 [Verrucomicrobiota bacterium]|jgi:arylsulfatase A-like enzyme
MPPALARLAAAWMAAASLGLLTAHAAHAASPARPNILFLAVDDLRPELGCYGSPIVQSPNLDRLARSGVVFDRAYCQQAVCSPSRSSLMTGTRPDTTKVWDLKTHFRKALPDVVTLGQHFKNHGYFVQGAGKIYHGNYDDKPTWSVPFGTIKAVKYALPSNAALEGEATARNKAEAAEAKAKGKARQDPDQAPRGPAFEKADVPDDTFQDGKLAVFGVERLREFSRQPNQPFFLALGFRKPHLPFVAPAKYWDLYDPARIALAPNPFRPKDAPSHAIVPGGELRSYHGIPDGPIPDPLARQLKHGYYAAISYMDAQVGKVLDELDRLNLRTNTIIVLWGDHGWKLGEHGAWCKHSNVENDVHAPLLLAAPGLKNPGRHSAALVEFVDIYPTLCDLAGLPLPPHLEGLSFKPVLDDPARPWKKAAFSQYPRSSGDGPGRDLMGYSMRTDRYRLTRWVHQRNPAKVEAVELYDHQADPQENMNLAGQAAHADLVQRLTRQWEAGWRGALPDPQPAR